MRAEQVLSNDEKIKHIWQAYLEGLGSELGLKVKPNGDIGWQAQVSELLDAKAKELEEKNWKVHFGDHTVEVRDLLTRTFKSILAAKDIINSAASASPPAAIACAGATVILSVRQPLLTYY